MIVFAKRRKPVRSLRGVNMINRRQWLFGMGAMVGVAAKPTSAFVGSGQMVRAPAA